MNEVHHSAYIAITVYIKSTPGQTLVVMADPTGIFNGQLYSYGLQQNQNQQNQLSQQCQTFLYLKQQRKA